MMRGLAQGARSLLPKIIYRKVAPFYNYMLAFFGALLYRFPSRNIFVIGITGTKGKTTTVEIINAILEEAEFKTALAGTLRFKIAESDSRNMFKMTMPGRFHLQKFLRDAVSAGCTHAIIEMTSEGARQFRHKFIYLDALIFTNLSPEHIESHGSYEAYVQAKLKLARALETSPKKEKVLVANADSKEVEKFLSIKSVRKIPYRLSDAEPYTATADGSTITFLGEKIPVCLPGVFNIYNILGAAFFARSQNIPIETIKRGIERISFVRGRMEKVSVMKKNGMPFNEFNIYVDYAHTADSLEKVYVALGSRDKICVLGGTGGGRDKWKRAEMGKIAAEHCKKIILTNEDPYDEDPVAIVEEIKKGIGKEKDVEIEMDRREAIRKAVFHARPGDAVIVTGKGTDPFIMGPRGTKISWDDASVAREVLEDYIERRTENIDKL